jgi:FixJ family two-component response regulator
MISRSFPGFLRVPQKPAIVYIVDDDVSVRRALKRLINSVGMNAEVFESPSKFLDYKQPSPGPCCVVADLRMRDMTGLELQREIVKRGSRIPFIFVTGHDTDESRSEAKKAGAAGYFRKPVDDQALLDAIVWALSQSE